MFKKSKSVLNGTNSEVVSTESHKNFNITVFLTDKEQFVQDFHGFAVKTAQSTLEMCRVVYEAKTSLTKDEYLSFLNDIGHKSETSTIRKYLAIGEKYDKLIQYAVLLPNSWTSIYTLTQLSSETFDALAMTDTDMSVMNGKQIKSLIEINKPLQKTSASAPTNSLQTQSSNNSNTLNCSSSSSDASQSVAINSADISVDQIGNLANDSVTDDEIDLTISNNKCIDVVSSDDTFEVLIRFKSKPTDNQWWDLTEAIETVMDERNLDIEVIETRPLFEKV